MKKIVFVSALALTLASCAKDERPEKPMFLALDPHNPQVDVTVDPKTGVTNITAPDMLYFPSTERCTDKTITWHLSAPKGHHFHAGAGIQFGPDAEGDIVGCHYIQQSETFECTNKHCKEPFPRTYKYTINIDDEKGNPHPKDPGTVNN